MSLLSVLFIGARITVDESYASFKVKYFTEVNKELRDDYAQLNNRINLAENILGELQKRDDKVYRSVFDLEPIPSSVREAGFGGSEKYYPQLYTRDIDFVSNTAQKLDQLSNKVKVQSLSLSHLYLKAQEQQLILMQKPSISPISPADEVWLSSSYGYRKDPFTNFKRMHHGIDLAGEVGIKIFATGNGICELAKANRYGYGKEIIIDHGFGYTTIYAHLNKIYVKEGETVKRGQLIGELGNTGRSTGPHLHYEVWENNKPVNPIYFFYENLSPLEYLEIASN